MEMKMEGTQKATVHCAQLTVLKNERTTGHVGALWAWQSSHKATEAALHAANVAENMASVKSQRSAFNARDSK